MIQLTRIAPEDPIKRLRAQINSAMNEIEGDQPMVGLGSDVEADYWNPDDNDIPRHVAHSDRGTIHGTLLLQCLPDNTDAVITDVNGMAWPGSRPKLDTGITKLRYTWVMFSIHKVSLPTRSLTTFKTLVDYGFTKQSFVFDPAIEHITREPVFPLGGKLIYQDIDRTSLITAEAYLSGTRDKCMLLLSTGPLGDRE